MFKKSLLLCFLFAAACGPSAVVNTGPSASQIAWQQYNEAARAAGLPIVIDFIGVSWPNSAGGVNFVPAYTNTSDKTIKYITAVAQAYNGVGDTVRGQIRRSSNHTTRYTGPLRPDAKTSVLTAENAWYNSSIP